MMQSTYMKPVVHPRTKLPASAQRSVPTFAIPPIDCQILSPSRLVARLTSDQLEVGPRHMLQSLAPTTSSSQVSQIYQSHSWKFACITQQSQALSHRPLRQQPQRLSRLQALKLDPAVEHPVLNKGKPGDIDDAKIGCGLAMWFPKDEVYRMWYYTNSKAQNDNGDVPKALSLGIICLAESEDFVNWKKKGPVLTPSAESQDWDSGGIGLTSAAWINEEVWLPLFGQDKLAQGKFGRQRLGLARSKDGVSWSKVRGSEQGGAILEGSDDKEAWESSMPFCPGLVQTPDGSYILYYHSSKQRERGGQKRNVWMIGYATSSDGVHFEKGGPITWTNELADMDFAGQAGPAVIPNPYSKGYLMAYTAIDKEFVPNSLFGKWNTGLATSTDGVTWTRLGDQPIARGEEGHWDEHGVGHPSLCLGPDGLLRMLYHAFPNQGVGARILEDRGDLTRWKRI